MNRIIFLSFVASLFLADANAQNAKGYVPGRVLVYFKEGHLNSQALNHNNKELDFESLFVRQAFRDSLKSFHGILSAKKVIRKARPDKRFSESRTGEQVSIPLFHNLICMQVHDTTNIIRLCKLLAKRKEIVYAQPEFLWSATVLTKPITPEDNVMPVQQPNDPNFSRGLNDPVNHADINALRAWDFTYGSSNIRVGIIDSGIDYTNPELGGTFGSNAIKVTGGFDYLNQDSDPMDDAADSHGTGMAGIVGALTNNGQYVAGVAGGDHSAGNNGVQLIALKVAGDNVSNCSNPPCAPTQSIVEAIYDAATSTAAGGYGCHVINCSFGATDPSGFFDNYTWVGGINAERGVLSYAAINGVVLVAAKGNDHSNEMFYPADFADNLVISVGAMDGSNQRAGFSNYGNGIDLIAPGVVNSVTTTGRMATGVVQSVQGTSVAAPFVAGAAALLKSVNPNLHRDDVEKILKLSATDILDDNLTNTHNMIGYDQYTGYGKLNAGRALEMISAPYVLQQSSVTGGTVYNNPSSEQITLINDAGNGLTSGTYIGKRYDVRTTITIPASLCNERYIWARTSGATLGWSAAVPNNEMGYSEILSIVGNTVTLRTWAFYIQNTISGQQINAYYPTDPNHVVFAYTTLTNQPVTSITGPSLACTSGNFSLQPSMPNTTVTWSSSNPNGLSINPSTGAAIRMNNYNGTVSVFATVNGSCGSLQATPVNVWVGLPAPQLISGPGTLCEGKNGTICVSQSAGTTSYAWTSNSPNVTAGGNTACGWVIGETAPGGQITLSVVNPCGTTQKNFNIAVKTCTGGKLAVAAYPNPASTTLSVASATVDDSGNIVISSSGQSFSADLIDSVNQLRRSASSDGSKLIFDVSDLPKGVYFLRLTTSDGVSTSQIYIDK